MVLDRFDNQSFSTEIDREYMCTIIRTRSKEKKGEKVL